MLKIESIRLKPYQKEIFIFLSFVCIGFAIFYPSFLNQNYFWDDERFVFMNPEVLQAPNWYSFWNFKSEFFKSWPLGYSIFWSLMKYSPVNSYNFYKSLNIIFHVVNAYLILRIIRSLKFPFPVLLSFVFLLHPLHVETVSWIFQLLTILSFTFFLISFLFLIKFSKSKRYTFMAFSLLFFIFSLWTKSTVLLAPFLFVLILWSSSNSVKKKSYLLLIPLFITALHVGYVNIRGSQIVSNQKASIEKFTGIELVEKLDTRIQGAFEKPLEKIKANDEKLYFDFIFNKTKTKSEFIFDRTKIFNQASWHYFSKVLIPVKLQFIYPSTTYHFSLVLFSLFVLFILPFVFYYLYKDKLVVLIPAMSLVFISPYLGVTSIAFFYWSNVSDRYTYGFIMVLVYTLGLLAKKYDNKIFKISLVLYCAFLVIQNFNYGLKFNRPLALYEEIIEYKAHPVIYSLLFEQYFMKLDSVNAEQTLTEGLRKFPDDPQLNQDLFRMKNLKHFYEQNKIPTSSDKQ